MAFPWRRPSTELIEMREQIGQLEQQLTETRTTFAMSPSQARLRKASSLAVKGNDEELLYAVYLQIPWIAASFKVIARRMVSGGFEMQASTTSPNPANKEKCLNLFGYISQNENLLSLVYKTILALLIFGRAYWEVVPVAGEPAELYYVNPITIKEEVDERGEISGYRQVMEDGSKVELKPSQLLRFVTTGPLGEITSPMRELATSATLWQYMTKWGVQFFRNGARLDYWIELAAQSSLDDLERWLSEWAENYQGVENAHQVPIMAEGALIHEFASRGPIELDFLKTKQELRSEFLAVIGVPPAMVSLIESGNIGGGTGEAQDKTLDNNVVKPYKEQILEQVNFVLVQQGLGVDDWVLDLPQANYRGDDLLIKEVVEKVNAGLITRHRAAKLTGDPPDEIGPGGKVASITLTREIIPVPDLQSIHGSQFQAAQQAAMTTGLVPNTNPKALAQASPRDPLSAGPDHPVAQRDAQMQQAPKPGQQEAAEDLKRWQRLALKALKDGTPTRPFVSESIDPLTHFAVSKALEGVSAPGQVREVFDAAFADLRAS